MKRKTKEGQGKTQEKSHQSPAKSALEAVQRRIRNNNGP